MENSGIRSLSGHSLLESAPISAWWARTARRPFSIATGLAPGFGELAVWFELRTVLNYELFSTGRTVIGLRQALVYPRLAMILSDRDLRASIEKGEIGIDPLDDPELQIQPASIDLRLSNRFVVYNLPHVPCIDSRDPESVTRYTEEIVIEEGSSFTLHPGEFALGSTVERIRVPDHLVARVEGRSSIGRIAVVVHATAGFIDPGFEGEITLELANLGRCAVKLYPGMRISQVVFHTMTSPAERPYGPARGSKYQGQSGPIASRLAIDPKMRM